MPVLPDDEDATLQQVNDHVNANTVYQEGKAGWQLDNLPDGGSGDCDSIARTKAEQLVKAGFPKDNLQIQVVKMDDGQDHALLRAQKKDGTIKYLDMLQGSGNSKGMSVRSSIYDTPPGKPTGVIIPYHMFDRIRDAAKSQHPEDNPDKITMR